MLIDWHPHAVVLLSFGGSAPPKFKSWFGPCLHVFICVSWSFSEKKKYVTTQMLIRLVAAWNMTRHMVLWPRLILYFYNFSHILTSFLSDFVLLKTKLKLWSIVKMWVYNTMQHIKIWKLNLFTILYDAWSKLQQDTNYISDTKDN